MSKSYEDAFVLDQVAVRLVHEQPLYSDTPINTPYDAVRVIAAALSEYDREVFCVVNLKTDGKPINFSIVSMGALNISIAHPREFFKSVFLSNAESVILVHNHPSGNLTPSREDYAITNRLADLCARMGVGLRDHIIVAGEDPDRYYSFMEQGELSFPTFEYSADKIDYGLSGLAKVAEHQSAESDVAETPPEKESVLTKLAQKQKLVDAYKERKRDEQSHHTGRSEVSL